MTSNIGYSWCATNGSSAGWKHGIRTNGQGSLPPTDIVVAVGSGDNVQEFHCHKFVLSCASEVLGVMARGDGVFKENLNHRIEFPEVEPEDWEEFYKFIDPQVVFCADNDARIDMTNVTELVPMFHRFQMMSYVDECDKFLSTTFIGHITKPLFRSELDLERQEAHSKLIELHDLGSIYNLEKTKKAVRDTLAEWIAESLRSFLLHQRNLN